MPCYVWQFAAAFLQTTGTLPTAETLLEQSRKFIKTVSCMFPQWHQVELYALFIKKKQQDAVHHQSSVTSFHVNVKWQTFLFSPGHTLRCMDIKRSTRILILGTASNLLEESSTSIVQFLSDLHTGASGYRTRETVFWRPSVDWAACRDTDKASQVKEKIQFVNNLSSSG